MYYVMYAIYRIHNIYYIEYSNLFNIYASNCRFASIGVRVTLCRDA